MDASTPRTPYSQQATGLLDQIAERALDDDYYLVRDGRYSRSRTANTLATAAMLAVFALMITVTAVQNQRDRPTTELTRETLLADVDDRQAANDRLEAQAAELRADVEALQAVDDDEGTGRPVRVLAGAVEVSGPGVEVTIDPGDGSVSDSELRGVVNALWYAGAEAVAVNGQRIGALSSIRSAAGTTSVNFRPVGPPYSIQAIGDADAIRSRFETSGESDYWERRERDSAWRFRLDARDSLVLAPAPESRTTVGLAVAQGGPS